MNYYVIEQALQLNLSTGIKVGKDLRGHLILYSLHHHRSNVYLTPLTGNSLLFKKAHFIFRKLLLNLDMSSVPIFFFYRSRELFEPLFCIRAFKYLKATSTHPRRFLALASWGFFFIDIYHIILYHFFFNSLNYISKQFWM